MTDQSPAIKIAAHDRLIKSATIAAEREINLDTFNKYQDTIAEFEPGVETSIVPGLSGVLEDGKIYFKRDEASELHFQSLVRERAMQLLVGQGKTIKQAVLKMLWEYHRDQMLSYRGEDGAEYNPEDLPQFVNKNFAYLAEGDGSDYTDQMVFIVLRVLQPVYARQLQGKPYLTPDGEIITVELLVDTPKMLTKLRDINYIFEDVTEEQKTDLLTAAVTGKVQDVKEAKDKINGKSRVLITGSWTVHSKGDTYSVEMDGLNEEQINYIEKALGSGWEQVLR